MKKLILFKKSTCVIPTKSFWVLFISISIMLVFLIVCTIHPYLASNNPVNGEAIIIEGWLPDYCFEIAASLVKQNHYRAVFVTGIPLETGSYLKEYKTYAELGAATLKMLSIPDSQIISVPAPYAYIDRTYSSALALKKWLDSTNCSILTFDICSQSTHTRRSALLFKRALGSNYKIGSIAINHHDYNPRYWWKSSQGVRSVIDETIAFIYASIFIFYKNQN